MSEPAQYAAFLSYSHRDKRWADWLHRAIETYRPPVRLGERAVMRAALRPIFRDRDELPASPDLSQQIDEALAASRALIVLCSPSAARSQWTNAEIARFKRLHPDRPILAVLIAGEPYASEIPGREDEEAFPPALRFQVGPDGALTDERAEPIAADLRTEADGRRLGKLKVIAGLLGVRLDELVQRETARRNRRFAFLGTALIIGMAATTTLALYAFHQRAEAVKQREQADGLIDFMLTDLRRKLEPVGRLDVLEAVGDRALGYYAKQDLADIDANALGRRAGALQIVGRVANERGNLDRALALFKQAAKITAEQLRRDPDNPQRVYDHAQSVFWVGTIAHQRNDIPTALAYFTQYRELAQRLASISNGKPAWQAELGYAEVNLGVIDLNEEHWQSALIHFEAARAVFARVSARVPDDPELVYWLCQTLGRKAEARRGLGDYPGAVSEWRAQEAAYQRFLARDPHDTRAMSGIAVAWLRLAKAAIDAGSPVQALSLADRSITMASQLEEKDETYRMYREIAVKAMSRKVEALMMIGKWREARRENAGALDASQRLVATDRTFTTWRTQCLMQARWMQIAIDRKLATPAAVRARIDAFARDFPEGPAIADAEELFARTTVLTISAVEHRARSESVAADADLARAARLLRRSAPIVDPRIAGAARAVHKLVPSSALPVLVNDEGAGDHLLSSVLSKRVGG